MPQTCFPSNFSSSLQEVTFSKAKHQVGMPILETWYKHSGYQYDNVFILLDYEVDYTLTYWFVKSEIINDNVDKFLINPLIKSITE